MIVLVLFRQKILELPEIVFELDSKNFRSALNDDAVVSTWIRAVRKANMERNQSR